MTPYVFSEYNEIKLQTNSKRNPRTQTQIKHYRHQAKMETQHTKTYGTQLNQSQESYLWLSDYIKKSERSQINNLLARLRSLGKEQAKSQISKQKEISKIKQKLIGWEEKRNQ